MDVLLGAQRVAALSVASGHGVIAAAGAEVRQNSQFHAGMRKLNIRTSCGYYR